MHLVRAWKTCAKGDADNEQHTQPKCIDNGTNTHTPVHVHLHMHMNVKYWISREPRPLTASLETRVAYL